MTSSELPVFTIDHSFDAPRDVVWQAWTDPKLLAQWFGPKGTTCSIMKHELKPGGVVHTKLEAPGMPPMYGKFVYREIVPQEKLVWEHSFSDEGGVNLTRHPFAPTWPLQLLTTITFAEKKGKTALHLTWVPLNANPIEIETFRAALSGMEQGWGGSFENLDQQLKKKAA